MCRCQVKPLKCAKPAKSVWLNSDTQSKRGLDSCALNQINLGIQPAHLPCLDSDLTFFKVTGSLETFMLKRSTFCLTRSSILLHLSFAIVTSTVDDNCCSFRFYNNIWVFHLYLALQTMKWAELIQGLCPKMWPLFIVSVQLVTLLPNTKTCPPKLSFPFGPSL